MYQSSFSLRSLTTKTNTRPSAVNNYAYEGAAPEAKLSRSIIKSARKAFKAARINSRSAAFGSCEVRSRTSWNKVLYDRATDKGGPGRACVRPSPVRQFAGAGCPFASPVNGAAE